MTLVAYDTHSDSGDSDEIESSCVLTIRSNGEGSTSDKMPKTYKDMDKKETTYDVSNRLFDLLPSPKKSSSELMGVEEKQDAFLSKKPDDVESPKPKVKILIPSLPEYDVTEDNPRTADRRTTSKTNSSSLFTMLPPPTLKSIQPKSLVPRVLQKNGRGAPMVKMVNKSNATRELSPNCEELSPYNNLNAISEVGAIYKKRIYKRKASISAMVSSDESDDEARVEYNNKIWKEVCGRKKGRDVREPCIERDPDSELSELTAQVDATEPCYSLDNEAFKNLVGYRKKPVEVNVVDILEAGIRVDPDIRFTKALTDPKYTKRYVPKKPVDDTRKKKHHITFLAEQAKVNQQDLENQWAASRQARKQTHAKYGF